MVRKKTAAVNSRDIESRVWELAEPLAASCGGELIDVEFVREAGEWYLRLFIDRTEAPVDHDLCEAVSDLVSAALDETDPISQSYYLEVSSPGLERPLKRPQDFARYAGCDVVARLYAARNGQKEFTGRLLGRDEDGVRLECGGEELIFPLAKIAKVHLKADF
ncbi:MAG: ribosome maturation factor RimP [Firmicutes bacterium]|nr:ribosome maturation factor RimP [Bacillota bacterium]